MAKRSPRELDEHGRKVLKGNRYYPEQLVIQGVAYYPQVPSRIVMGPDSWIQNQSQLRYRWGEEPGTITVYCPDDPQIMFPPPETWCKRPTVFQRLALGLV